MKIFAIRFLVYKDYPPKSRFHNQLPSFIIFHFQFIISIKISLILIPLSTAYSFFIYIAFSLPNILFRIFHFINFLIKPKIFIKTLTIYTKTYNYLIILQILIFTNFISNWSNLCKEWKNRMHSTNVFIYF